MKIALISALVTLATSAVGCQACVAALLAADDDTDNGHHRKANAPPNSDPVDPPPTPAPTNARAEATGGSRMVGRYACMQLRITAYPSVQITYAPGALPPFTIDGATYESGGTKGTVRDEGPIVAFTGGTYDGWRGWSGTDSSGAYIQFKNGAPGKPEAQLKHMDFKCYRQK